MAGAETFKARIEQASGVDVTIGSHAVAAALRAFGARRVAFMSPYFPAANAEVRRYLGIAGFDVVRDSFRALDGDDIDAIVQVGTNLSAVALAAAAERWLAKPVIAINGATYWHALRTAGLHDKVDGSGRLLLEF